MKIKRDFLVFHSSGVAFVTAPDAVSALSRAYIPSGFKHARGVLEWSFMVGRANARRPARPWIGIVGTLAGPAAQPEKARG